MSNTATQVWLTPNQAAERLGISKQTLWRWVAKGKIQDYKVPGTQTVRFKAEDLDNLLKPGTNSRTWAVV